MKMKYALVRAKAAAVMAVILTVLSAVLALNVNAAQIIDNGDYIYKLNEDGKTLSIINYKGNSLYLKLPSRVIPLLVSSLTITRTVSFSGVLKAKALKI